MAIDELQRMISDKGKRGRLRDELSEECRAERVDELTRG